MEGNPGSYSLKGADYKSGFIFFLKWRGATHEIFKVRVLPSNQHAFPIFPLLNLLILVPNLKIKTNLIDSIVKRWQEGESRSLDNWDKLTMIELLKVYETLYLNDQQKILFKLIIKSKFSNNFFKSVRQAY